jgi:hypothetical protein
MSSKQLGCRRLINSFIPRDSSWNTAVVSPRHSMPKVDASSRGMVLISMGVSPLRTRDALMMSRAQSMIVSVRRPRKSNFTSPTDSTSSLS